MLETTGFQGTSMIQPAREQPTLAEFLRSRHAEIITRWVAAVRALPQARRLDRPRLLDHIPKILELITDLVETGIYNGGVARALPQTPPDLHALTRLDEGYDLETVISEYTVLREVILELWETERGESSPLGELRIFNNAVDQAVISSLSRYTKARHRTLEALDRVSSVALASGNLEEFLPKLLEVVQDTTEAVDTVAVLLREGGQLRVRAAVGLDRALIERAERNVGEGFAGKVFAERRPVLLPGGSTNPLVQSEYLRARGLKVLYGVPLLHEGEVIGVAHMGSLTASDFSEEDRHILRSMARRATALIVQQQSREERERLLGELDRAVKARDEFVAVLSHDLRNPLSAITVGAELLARQLPPELEQLRKRARSIRTAAERAGRMIEELLDEIALAGGRTQFARVPLDPAGLVSEMFELYHPAAQDQQVTLEKVVAVGLPQVLGDRDYVLRAFGNLVANAQKFTPTGGTITLRAEPARGAVRFSVTDTGPGIEPESRARIFERGFRGKRGDAEVGLGLGLAIAKAIVEALGGAVGFESEVGKGSTFWFTLPVA
jgi:signal transduction histidine kinase